MKILSTEAIDLLESAFDNIISECAMRSMDDKKELCFAINSLMEKRVHRDITAYTSPEIINIKKDETDFMNMSFNSRRIQL